MLPGIYNFSLLTHQFDKLPVGGKALHMTLNSLVECYMRISQYEVGRAHRLWDYRINSI